MKFRNRFLPGRITAFSQASLENANSRVLAGIHYRSSRLAGLGQGQRIGDYVYYNVLRPIR